MDSPNLEEVDDSSAPVASLAPLGATAVSIQPAKQGLITLSRSVNGRDSHASPSKVEYLEF